MKSIVVGTAGHIDHGKTALVKALTGIDADRLEEEKRRGITIDLGFAHMDLPGAGGDILRIGFVDVPGHERFVRNMLAGVGGIDLVLLVIAADESIKPQTREHFDILQLLGVKRGITVLTKSDAVDADTLDVVRLEVEEFLRGTFLEPPQAPIVAVSSLTGAGLDDLRHAMGVAAASIQARDSHAIARLPIDRVFAMKGFGTVVTGTLLSGTIHPEEELEILPIGRRLRVRGVQVHGDTAVAAVAGQRTALNLAGSGTDNLARGMTLVPPATFAPTQRIDVELQLLPSAPRRLKTRSLVHVHAHTMESVAELRLYENDQIAPGETLFTRLTFPDPVLLLPGDRFIIRQFSPVITIGGGRVLDAAPMKRVTEVPKFLKLLTMGGVEEILHARILRRGIVGLTVAELIAETGWAPAKIEKALASMRKLGKIAQVGGHSVDASEVEALQNSLVNDLDQFHRLNPLVAGISREQLREQRGVPSELFTTVLDALARNKKVDLAGDLVRLPGRGVAMKDEESESKRKIEEAFSSTGLKVPGLQEVLAGLKIDKLRAQKIVTLLLRDRILVKVSDDLVFHRAALDDLRRQIAAQKTKSPKLDIALFKEITGVSRKYAIPLLEYLDRERVTKRLGDVRQIL